MAISIITSHLQSCDSNGSPLNAGTVTVYAATTTTPLSLYSDSALSVGVTNPITLDASGRHAMVYIATASYKLLLKNSAGTTIYTHDNIDPGVAVGSGALPVANGGTAATTAASARTNLAAAAATDMATAQSDISNLQTWDGYTLTTRSRHASGTTAQQPSAAQYSLRSDSTTGRLLWDNTSAWRNVLTAGDVTAADMLTGSIVQVQAATPYTANADLTTAVPSDDTIPQITEGTEILTITFTPKHASSAIFVIASFGVFANSTTGDAVCSLFKSTSTNALQVSAAHGLSAGNVQSIPPIFYKEAPGSVTPIVYSIRAGASTGTLRFNGSTAARAWGGAASCQLWVVEVRG